MLLDSFGAPIEGRVVGVDIAFCAFRNGDSGRGRDGLCLGLKSGLRARLGPMDWLNFEVDDDVVGVFILVSGRLPRPYES